MLEVTSVAVGESEFAWQVCFEALNSDEQWTYVMLSRSKETTEQDEELGQATHHIEWGDQLYSGYGLVDRLEVSDTAIKLYFNSKAAATLGVGETEELVLSQVTMNRSALLDELHRVLLPECEVIEN
ncbi:Imm10 family immunity protein [Planctomycetota bacterium]|nr:Imm10 family immunity protein [Planctomycetota bacterium]